MAIAEKKRISDARWKLWGPYLADRQWGTVREDYSRGGSAWEYFSHEQSRSRAYRWGEDGIGGISDDKQRLCFAPAFWNEKDPIIKERLFGLTGNEGNHGEDVKELYYYLDSSPTHSYMKMLYKYPQREFPYSELVAENKRRGKGDPEFEILDTGIFDDDRYFDLFIEYAKNDVDDILIKITAENRGPDSAPLHIIPQLWFRNTWSWRSDRPRPEIEAAAANSLRASKPSTGQYHLYFEGSPGVLFTDNETNGPLLFGLEPPAGLPLFFKDGINDCIASGKKQAVNPAQTGTKAGLDYRVLVAPGGSAVVRLRLFKGRLETPFQDFDRVFLGRMKETDEYYADLQSEIAEPDMRLVQRQAFAGMLWSKQFYYYNVREWLEGDSRQPVPPTERKHGRNAGWEHMNNADVISMPDKWEYPWYAAWDLAFHCIPLAMLDSEFAKNQLLLLTKEWYMHPNGQLPAYEWALGDVNPPVHAWATWRVYKIDKRHNNGVGDKRFLERVFHKLLLNFTWWVNRKDAEGRNIFQGGFLGLDNIGVFDRSAQLPTGGFIEQSDGTAWMAMYSLNLMRIALELSMWNPSYQELAIKFFEHFLYIAEAMVNIAGEGLSLWDDEDKFYYDVLHMPDGSHRPLKLRSMVGLIPMFAVETLEPELMQKLPDFRRHLEWFLNQRPDLANLVSRWQEPGSSARSLLSLLRGHRMKKLLVRLLDESEFLSDYGVRALSKAYDQQPYEVAINGSKFQVKYQPGESDTGLFGGNSNWRGPIWMPMNFLLIESLQKFHHYYGDDFKIECPTGSGRMITINEAADELTHRLGRLFLRDKDGRRPVFGNNEKMQTDPHFKDYLLFYEYFHGDTGRGVGASHQTGWTGLIAKLLQPRRSEIQSKREAKTEAQKSPSGDLPERF